MMRIPVLKGQGIAQNITLVVLFLMINVANMSLYTKDQYLKNREILLREEAKSFTGGDLNLTKDEGKVNQYLLNLKKEELQSSYHNPSKFLAGQNFLLAKEEIEKSKLFEFIKKIPKGGSLHTHLLGGVNISWQSLNTYREEYAQGNLNFDEFLKDEITLRPEATEQSRETVWAKFQNTLPTLSGLIEHKRSFKEYITQLLEELYEDNVIYTELRGPFMFLWDSNGAHNTNDFIETLKETVDEFRESHSNFIGVKYINSIHGGVDNFDLRNYLDYLIHYRRRYPELIAGFDLVGLEEDGKNLVDFHEELLNVTKDLHFFFHAGETNQYGRTDLNLADAILLNSSRISNAFALAKHPRLLEAARKRNIAVELSPISNQVLELNNDPRNHPATVLLSQGHPVVICNDDPSTWETTGLSYDWYVVFMSMTWEDHGLTVLKKFAQNSITYSALNDNEKAAAFQVWQRQWDGFIKEIVESIA